jgi:hypothetical protein
MRASCALESRGGFRSHDFGYPHYSGIDVAGCRANLRELLDLLRIRVAEAFRMHVIERAERIALRLRSTQTDEGGFPTVRE